jgi:hypothetical protein
MRQQCRLQTTNPPKGTRCRMSRRGREDDEWDVLAASGQEFLTAVPAERAGRGAHASVDADIRGQQSRVRLADRALRPARAHHRRACRGQRILARAAVARSRLLLRRLWPSLLSMGMGIRLVVVASTEAIVGNTPAELSGVAGGIQSTFTQLGGVLGSGIPGSAAARLRTRPDRARCYKPVPAIRPRRCPLRLFTRTFWQYAPLARRPQ